MTDSEREREENIARIQDCPEIIGVMLKLLEDAGYKVITEELKPLRLIKGGHYAEEKG